jgi:hypothetical protein
MTWNKDGSLDVRFWTHDDSEMVIPDRGEVFSESRRVTLKYFYYRLPSPSNLCRTMTAVDFHVTDLPRKRYKLDVVGIESTKPAATH